MIRESDRARIDQFAATVTDETGALVYASPRFCRLTGFDPRTRYGSHPPHPWCPPEEVERSSKRLRRVSRRSDAWLPLEAFPCRLLRSDASELDLLVRYVPLLDDAGKVTAHAGLYTPASIESLFDYLLRLREGGTPTTTSSRLYEEVTAREGEVLALILKGHSTGQIASSLGVRANTVRNHVRSILRKAGLHSRRELVARMMHESRPD